MVRFTWNLFLTKDPGAPLQAGKLRAFSPAWNGMEGVATGTNDGDNTGTDDGNTGTDDGNTGTEDLNLPLREPKDKVTN